MIVFVYGTLMKGLRYHDLLSSSEYVGNGILDGYAMVDIGSFPGIVKEENQKVKGELYRINRDTLRSLDQLEGEGSLYIRANVMVQFQGNWVDAMVYVYNQSINGKKRISFDQQPYKG